MSDAHLGHNAATLVRQRIPRPNTKRKDTPPMNEVELRELSDQIAKSGEPFVLELPDAPGTARPPGLR